MKTREILNAKHVGAMAVSAGLILCGCTQKPSISLEADLSVSPAPVVDRIVNLLVQVDPLVTDNPNTTVTVTLPPQVELLAGDSTWHGDLAAHEPVTLDLTIRVTEPGIWQVSVVVISVISETSQMSVIDEIYLQSTELSGQVINGEDMPHTPPPVFSGTLFGP